MSEYVQAWQCIGCGRIEAPQTCVGICQDRKVEFVYADEYQEALAQLAIAQSQAQTFRALLRQLAWTTPHDGEWQRSYRALQEQARRVLDGHSSGSSDPSSNSSAERSAHSPAMSSGVRFDGGPVTSEEIRDPQATLQRER